MAIPATMATMSNPAKIPAIIVPGGRRTNPMAGAFARGLASTLVTTKHPALGRAGLGGWLRQYPCEHLRF